MCLVAPKLQCIATAIFSRFIHVFPLHKEITKEVPLLWCIFTISYVENSPSHSCLYLCTKEVTVTYIMYGRYATDLQHLV